MVWPRFACPQCHHPLDERGEGWICRQENLLFTKDGGIPCFILPERRTELEGFLETYQLVRREEGWGAAVPEYIQDLPYRDQTGKHSRVWSVRARTLGAFLDHLSKQPLGSAVRVLDVGAGNCWFSWRMAARGSQVVALDVNVDPLDGLGALQLLPQDIRSMILPVRADFDNLPFGPGEFDLVVFNASLHYSHDVARTLAAAMDALVKSGIVYILDSPFYASEESGHQMILARNQDFMTRFNRQVPVRASEGYLTLDMFRDIRARYRVEIIAPPYGIRWALRPYIARFLWRREPATFRIVAIHKD